MMLAESITLENGLLFFGAMLALTFVSLGLVRRNRRQAARDQVDTRERIAKLSGNRQYSSIADEVMIKLEELSRRVSAQVDTRFTKLECVIRDADERAARLEKLLAQNGPAAAKPPEHTPAQTTNVRDADPSAANAPPSEKELPPRVRRVYELADEGKAPLAIAEALELPVGEVELILNLRALR